MDRNTGRDVAHSRADEVFDNAWQSYAISAGRIKLPTLTIGVEIWMIGIEAPTLTTRERSEEGWKAWKAEGRK